MALIYCPDCGKEVSESANTCPNCAYPINRLYGNLISKQNNQLVIAGYIIVFMSLFIFPVLLMISGIVIGIINISKNAVGHGIVQIILSVVCGLVGAFVGILSTLL